MSVPATMRVVEITAPGACDVLKIGLRPVPVLQTGEVLVRVAAAGVNRPDVSQRQGHYPPPPGVTDIPGLEIAGTIVSVADGAAPWKVGDTVCALVAGGGYAEYCAVPAVQCLRVPAGLSMVEAASLPETFFTVWVNVFDRARLAPGEWLLVHGGTSGIGVAAIQMARALGSRVIATAGTPEKCAACTSLGADVAVNYRTGDFVEAALKATDGRGVDVILDMVGGEYVEREIRCLAEDGRLSMIASLGGARGCFIIPQLTRKRLTITGSTLRPRPPSFKGAVARSLEERIWPLIEAGRIRPVVHATFPLHEAPRAHALMESSGHIGKIVLTVE